MTGAYPEIFGGRGFEIFLYGRENLYPQNPTLNTPLDYDDFAHKLKCLKKISSTSSVTYFSI